MENHKRNRNNEIVGAIFLLFGLFSILGWLFNADGASPGAGIFGIAIGLPLFWPRIKKWLNNSSH